MDLVVFDASLIFVLAEFLNFAKFLAGEVAIRKFDVFDKCEYGFVKSIKYRITFICTFFHVSHSFEEF